MTRKRFTTREMTYIALMAVLLAACAWLTVPAPVPFTLQTFAVFCALGLLGGRRGTVAVLLYLLLGAAGLPVFAGFQGGLGRLLGPTGGYLMGFLFSALIYWLLERWMGDRMPRIAAALLLGLLVCYAFGTAWFVVYPAARDAPTGLVAALGLCVLPFIVPDLIKLSLAMLLIRRFKKYLRLP